MKTINKTKKIALLAGICAAVLLAAGCNDDKNVLANTKWKLVGIVNTETGEIRELEPKDCEECYTLTFTKSKATAFGVNRTTPVNILKSENVTKELFCERYYKDGKDYCDSDDFREALAWVGSYTALPNELRLHYLDKYYLLFKAQQ